MLRETDDGIKSHKIQAGQRSITPCDNWHPHIPIKLIGLWVSS